MYLADYHTHTQCSADSQTPLMEQAEQAVQMGLSELCTTDHFDLLDVDGNRVYDLDYGPILEQFEQAQAAFEGRLRLKLGLELGGADADPDCARRVLDKAPLDFVIGSIHNLSLAAGGGDLCRLAYRTSADCYAALDDYFNSMARLVRTPGCCDVLGHVIYPLRYMKEMEDGPITLDRYWEQLRDILTAAADAGIGIELNTYCGRTLEEWTPILALYRDCGGEIITVGSDAHAPSGIGQGFMRAHELLKAAGFRYQAVYQGRRPQFKKL